MSAMPHYHLMIQFGQWSLLEEGAFHPVKTFRSKREAFVYGLNYAADRQGGVTIHKEDGSKQEEHSYASAGEPFSRVH